jgi:hypothetical protein
VIEKTETANQALKNIEKSLEHAVVSTFTKGLVNDLSTNIFKPAAGALGIKLPGATDGAGAAAAPIAAAFTTGSTTVTTALTTAFATGAAQLSEAITLALASGQGAGLGGLGGIASSGAAAIGTDTSALADTISSGFAIGGYTGDGATHMPAGIVHGQEFVHRAEVVKQPGALSFLSDFNERGMQAVASYAGGGFVPGAGFSPIITQGYAAGGPVKSIDTLPALAASSGGSRADIGKTINTALNTGGQQAGGTLVDSMAQGGAIAGQTIASSMAQATQAGTGLSAGGSNTYSKTNNDKGIFGLVMLAAGLGKSLLKGGSSVPTVGNSAPSASLTNSVPVNLPSGFDIGGYTGDGGKYQPAGIVHAGEFVHRQEVVSQPGAMQFLTAFNEKGMAALGGYALGGRVSHGWSPPAPLTVGYADGGMVAGLAPSSVAPSVAMPRASTDQGAARARHAGTSSPAVFQLHITPDMVNATIRDVLDGLIADDMAKR